eukprot:TRINITY_DN82080_c0_g1_i1.p2 TRINITY_DN82080_c0_g1~~TRINITY_DN82080_c0_g1_i1.p2  ORF type:complete len:462 (-),score=88.82 TRINITY_DN82080_c0_g1_i1:87-1472(-)
MKLVLLNLDEHVPLIGQIKADITHYLQAFFCHPIEHVDVPDTPVSPPGWEALRDRVNLPIKNRPARGDISDCDVQFYVPELVFCAETLMQGPGSKYGVEIDGADLVLCMTGNELYSNEAGLIPGDPVPEERTRRCFVRSRRLPLGVCSLSKFEAKGGDAEYRRFTRLLFKFFAHCFLDLLGLLQCQSRSCMGFARQFSEEGTPFFLCPYCEEKLLKRVAPVDATFQDLVRTTVTRYRTLSDVLSEVSHRLGEIKIGMRIYVEFEDDCDWLRVAEEIFREVASDRHSHLGKAGVQVRRRSFLNCLIQAHDRQMPQGISRRTYSEPMLKRTCLVDMSQSIPYRHECGDMFRWTTAIKNKKHRTGGFYVELGGSLRPKTIASFVDTGLNATLVRSDGSPEMNVSQQLQQAKLAQSAGAGAAGADAGISNRLAPVQERALLRRRNATSMGYTIKKMQAHDLAVTM